jgi:PAS domain S-box-containing protein
MMYYHIRNSVIYISSEDNTLIEKFSVALYQNSIKYSYISPEALYKCISKMPASEISHCIMDHSTFCKIQVQKQEVSLKKFSAIVLLLKEQEFEHYVKKNLPENFCLLPYNLTGEAYLFFLEAEIKRSKSRVDCLKNQNTYKSLFDKSRRAKLIVNPCDGQIIDANEAASKLFGISLEHLIEANLKDLHPEKADDLFLEMKNVMHNSSETVFVRLTLENDTYKELEVYIRKIETDSQQALCLSLDDITEKEKAGQKIYQQHEILKSTLESIDDLFFTLDNSGNFTEYFQPDGSNTQFSFSSDIFIGKNIAEVGFPDDVAQKYLDIIKQVIFNDKPEQIDYCIEAFGSKLWYNARISPRKNVFGMPEGVTVLCRDVSRQKKSEDTIKRARDFYLTLLTDFPTMIWKTNTSKRADYFNNTWLEFTGNELETELQLDWVEKIHYNDVTGFLSTLLKAYKTKTSFQFEHRLKNKAGEYKWVYNVGSPFYNLEGHFAGFIGSCTDISERRKAEEMLNLQKSAMESALEGILIIDAEKHNCPVIYANSELSNITGIPKENILGLGFLGVLGNPLNDNVNKDIITSLKNKTSYKGEIFCKDSKGRDSWRLLYMSPVKDEKNGNTHFVAVLSDITDSKEAEKVLREKNRELHKTNEELDRFVYSTSHELRSPLMSVLGLLNLVEAEAKFPEGENGSNEQFMYLGMIRDTISRLDKIIHDIIDYSRNARLDVICENIDFKDFIDASVNNHRFIEGVEKVNFKIDIQNKHLFFSDKRRISIILNSLISNCLRFHNYQQENPFVEIKIKTSPVNALITIGDNGPGIAEKHIPKLYDMFYRGSEKSTGSGIGLYIVKEIVSKLRGTIQVHSALNKGTTFIIDLPNYLERDKQILSMDTLDYLSLQ